MEENAGLSFKKEEIIKKINRLASTAKSTLDPSRIEEIQKEIRTLETALADVRARYE